MSKCTICVSIFLSQLNDKNDTPCFNRILPRVIVNTPEDDKKAKPASKKTNTVTELVGMEVVLAKMAEQNSEAIADRIKDFLKMRKIGKKSKVCGTQEDLEDVFARIGADNVIADPKLLSDATRTRQEVFFYILMELEKLVREDPSMPLLRDNLVEATAGNPGSRCKLPLRHMLLATLDFHASHTYQHRLARDFRVSQPTISRTIKLISDKLDQILPSPEKICQNILEAETQAEAEEFVPGLVLIHDGTMIQVQRPGKSDVRKEHTSRKRGYFMANTVLTTNKFGLFINISPTERGHTHDMEIFKELLFNIGQFIAELPGDKKVREIADSGFQGGQKDNELTTFQTPFKRKKGEDLTPEQKEYNRELNSERIIIEMMFARIKRFRILRDSNDWSLTKLNRTINRVAGLVNLHYLFGFVNPENTHRKGRKPGPKTYRNLNRPDRRERT